MKALDERTIRRCYDELVCLRAEALAIETEFAADLARLPDSEVDSARNLLHYVAVRRRDIRALQMELSRLGLSSLGRLEAHVLAGIDAVLRALARLSRQGLPDVVTEQEVTGFEEGDALLASSTKRLFGAGPAHRAVRIMVTLPSEAADDAGLVERLLRAGMDVARINSAHDDESAWRRMIDHIRRGETATGQTCRILIDLCGPKVRTGDIAASATRRPSIRLQTGDRLVVTGPEKTGRDARDDQPARIPCTLAGIADDVQIGHRIFFDDGEIDGVVEEIRGGELHVRITRTRPGGKKLRADKGINLPDSHLSVPSLSQDDLRTLDFAASHADIVGLSFVRTPSDVANLQEELDRRRGRDLGILLKVETHEAFENLPGLLLAGLRRPPLGVMVARGDLGVELGFERMAEVQEQILWLAEAAHVPVVWATQVLEQMNKTGMPTRGEVTDAAMSARAECVMLNKGPYVVETVGLIDDILVRMRDHNHKKTPMLRRLKVSEGRWQQDYPD
jgi:pyruvate kinase